MAAKSEQLQIRVSAAQKARLRRLADRAGQDVSSYVLARVLAPARAQFDAAVRVLRDESRQSFAFAEVADVLRDAPLADLELDVPPDGLAELSEFAANYLAALVEDACTRRSIAAPAWTRAIAPLGVPWFAGGLKSQRVRLLLVSPAAFKRRNLFVDPGVAGRV